MKNALKACFNVAALVVGFPGAALSALSLSVAPSLASLAILAVSSGLIGVGYRGLQKAADEKYKAENNAPPAP